MLGVGGRLRRPTVIRGYRMASTFYDSRTSYRYWSIWWRKQKGRLAAGGLFAGSQGTFNHNQRVEVLFSQIDGGSISISIDGCLLHSFIPSFITIMMTTPCLLLCIFLVLVLTLVHGQVDEAVEPKPVVTATTLRHRSTTSTATTTTTTKSLFTRVLTMGRQKQAEVIHHPIVVSPNVNGYELMYYYNHSSVVQHYSFDRYNRISEYDDDDSDTGDSSSSSISISSTTRSVIMESDDITQTASSTTTTISPFDILIYKEAKLQTSVGTAYYNCPILRSPTSSSSSSSLSEQLWCHIQIIFYSSNTITNQTINTIQLQGMLQPHYKNTNDIKNNNNNKLAILGGTGIYYGASGQATLSTLPPLSPQVSHSSVVQATATFSIRPISSFSASLDATTGINATMSVVNTDDPSNRQQQRQQRIRRRWKTQHVPPPKSQGTWLYSLLIWRVRGAASK